LEAVSPFHCSFFDDIFDLLVDLLLGVSRYSFGGLVEIITFFFNDSGDGNSRN
jgi:hypothetical protein